MAKQKGYLQRRHQQMFYQKKAFLFQMKTSNYKQIKFTDGLKKLELNTAGSLFFDEGCTIVCLDSTQYNIKWLHIFFFIFLFLLFF